MNGVPITQTVTITITPPSPTRFTVTGGDSYCSGAAGVEVGLSGSQSEIPGAPQFKVAYQLFRDGNPVGDPKAGTGNPISFGNQTVPGAYTVSGPFTPSGPLMNGSVNVSITPLPEATLVSSGTLSFSQSSVTLTVGGGNSYTFSSPSGPITSSGNTALVSQEGLYSVTVANDSGCVSTTSTPVTSNTATVTVSNPTTTTGTMGSPFSQSFTATGGVMPRSFSIASGSVPPGLSLSAAGVFSGTPTGSGSYTFRVRATDVNGCWGMSAADTLVISGLSGNTASSGAGIYNVTDGSCQLINCKLTNNTATQDGGGIYSITQGSQIMLSNCSLSGNSAVNGGGLYSDSGPPTLINCLIEDNQASQKGGGIYFSQMANYGSLTNCLLRGNSAMQGGAMYNGIASPTLTNCTISDNTASQGGALYNTYFSPTLRSSIIWHNHTSPGAETTFANTDGSTVLTRYCLIESGVTSYSAGEGNQTATISPFVSSTDFTLSTNSQAIDAGDPASTTATSGATDLAGNLRITNNRIDIGAYEYQGPFCLLLTITQQPTSGSSVCVGSTVTAMVSVSGTSPTYQWYKDGTSLGSAQQSAALILTNVQASRAGSYFVVVTSRCSSVTSTAFSLTVNPLPAATLTATPSMVLSCAQTSLTLTAGGGTSYTFTTGSGTLGTPGATNTLVVNSPGTYSVTMANASGCVSSTTTTVLSATGTVTVGNPTTTTATLSSIFSQSFTASGGSGLYNYSLASGSLPTGLSLNATTGVLSGTPTQSGSFPLTIKATDANGCSGVSATYTLTVLGGQLTVIAPYYNCASGVINFRTQGGDGSPIEYFATGITPWTSTPTQQIETELRADPKKIQLLARQNGLTVSYLFDLPAYCAGLPTPPQSSTNPAPLVSQGINAQVAVEREPYRFTIPAGTFTDPQGEPLTYYALALPASLTLQGNVISGTPTTKGGERW